MVRFVKEVINIEVIEWETRVLYIYMDWGNTGNSQLTSPLELYAQTMPTNRNRNT